MTLIARLLKLVQPPPAVDDAGHPEPVSPPPAATTEELAAALDALIAARADCERTILDAVAMRDRLLLVHDSDKQIAALDRTVDKAHLDRERYDLIRPQIQARLEMARTGDRAARYALHHARLIEVLGPIADARAVHERALAALVPVMQDAMRDGFNAELAVYNWPYPVDLAQQPSGVVRSIRDARLTNGPEQLVQPIRLYPIEFLEWTEVAQGPTSTAYMQGQQAGFIGPEAWALVNTGKAKFPDPHAIPPKPPAPKKKRKGARPDPVPQEVASVWGAGPIYPPDETGARAVPNGGY